MYKKTKMESVEYREMVKHRLDRGMCEECGENGFELLNVHHIDGCHLHNELDNFLVVCRKCHQKIHDGIHGVWGKIVFETKYIFEYYPFVVLCKKDKYKYCYPDKQYNGVCGEYLGENINDVLYGITGCVCAREINSLEQFTENDKQLLLNTSKFIKLFSIKHIEIINNGKIIKILYNNGSIEHFDVLNNKYIKSS